jgi:hypothetical protein
MNSFKSKLQRMAFRVFTYSISDRSSQSDKEYEKEEKIWANTDPRSHKRWNRTSGPPIILDMFFVSGEILLKLQKHNSV